MDPRILAGVMSSLLMMVSAIPARADDDCAAVRSGTCRVIVTTSTDQQPAHAFVTVSDDQPGVIIARAQSAGGDPARSVIVAPQTTIELQAQDLPDAWIGVRLTPVPAPLAAHIGDQGLMIANLAKGSPADEAGLQQYDVITAFNDKAIGAQTDLLEAIRANGAGQAAKLGITRGGKPQTITITPAKRPGDAAWQWKFAEPDAIVDNMLNLRGHALQLDPNGSWTWQDLGPLQHLPDVLKQIPQFDIDDLKITLDDANRDALMGQLHKHLQMLKSRHGADDADDDARIELRMTINQDGAVTTVQRDADGKFKVTQRDAGGNETTKEFATEADFAQGAPDAFKLFSRHPAGRVDIDVQTSDPDDLDKARQDYQIQIEELVREARDRAAEARQNADEARQNARRERVEVRRHVQKPGPATDKPADKADGAGAAGGNVSSVKVADDGRITIVVRHGGTKMTYEFENKDELRTQEPALYERVKQHLD